MARYDKYDPVSGGSRAESAAAVVQANWDRVVGVGINASGKAVVLGAGVSGFVAVTIVDRTKRKAGDILDLMRSGEILEVPTSLTAGSAIYLSAAGELTATKAGNVARVGWIAEAGRLVVDFKAGAEA